MTSQMTNTPTSHEAPRWARTMRDVTDYLVSDFLGGPRPWKFAWVINFQKVCVYRRVIKTIAAEIANHMDECIRIPYRLILVGRI